MTNRLIGAHMPMKGGLHNALRNGKAIGCTAVQLFTSSPQQWRAKAVTTDMVDAFKAAQVETGITEVVCHDSYLINLSHPTEEARAQSREGLGNEIKRCAQYGIKKVVSHMGSHKGQGEEEGLRRVSEEALRVLDETPDSVTILMETTAGQGSSLNHRFEHLAKILELTKGHRRLGVCLDTCHVFAAGYDIRTEEMYGATFYHFDQQIGFDRLGAIHCNDSKKGLGTRVDRHAHIGEGEIGLNAFKYLLNDPRLVQIPILLETPDADTMHAKNLEVLWSLIT